jgi:lysophospholipase L1-like esterase
MATGSAGKGPLIGSIIVAALIALVVGVVWANQRVRIEPPPSAPISLERSGEHEPPTFAVLGDDYAAGYGPGWLSSWVRLLGDKMCWSLMPVSGQYGAGIEGGTGFTTAGRDPGKASYLDRVATVTAGNPRVVLVEGGLNDQGAPTSEEITAAAARTFTALKEQVGTGTVIAIGPLLTPNPNTVPEEVARVSGAIAAAADAAGIPYIDPVAEQWLANPGLFGAEQSYPTTDGYREYTGRLIDKLTLIGLASACNH